MGRRPILGDKRNFFLRFAEKKIKFEALCIFPNPSVLNFDWLYFSFAQEGVE